MSAAGGVGPSSYRAFGLPVGKSGLPEIGRGLRQPGQVQLSPRRARPASAGRPSSPDARRARAAHPLRGGICGNRPPQSIERGFRSASSRTPSSPGRRWARPARVRHPPRRQIRRDLVHRLESPAEHPGNLDDLRAFRRVPRIVLSRSPWFESGTFSGCTASSNASQRARCSDDRADHQEGDHPLFIA
jgi:hypothetical protein